MYNYKVYDGDLVGWVNCKIEKVLNDGLRCSAITDDGTRLIRCLKEVNDYSEVVPDGSVYKIKKPTQN